MSKYQLAQVNIGLTRGPRESEVMSGFMARLDEINALAERSPGFVWRLQTEEGDATAIQAFDDPLLLVNMSVWENLESLKSFVYQSTHLELLREREAWFEKMTEVYQALWWIPAGHLPTVDEAKERLAILQREGAGPQAFTFAKAFPAPE